MLVLKSRWGDSFRLEGYGDELLFTPVEIREFEVCVRLIHERTSITFTMNVENPLVIRLGEADVEIWVERLFANSVRFSFDAPPVIGIFRLFDTVEA